MITAPLSKIKTATEAKFASWFASGRLRQWGVYNRRKIAGSTTWSQHAWGNAWDIGVGSLADGDKVVAWLRAEQRAGRLPVRIILWRVKDHWDHIHVEGSPKKTGTPPLQPTNSESEDEEMLKEWIKAQQKALNAGGFKGANGKTLKVDGILGPNTQFALDAQSKAAAESLSGSTVTGTFSGKVG